MLTKVKEIAQAKTTTREILVSNLNDMIDELETELEIVNDLHTVDDFFFRVNGFIDCDDSKGIESQIEDITGCKINSVEWFDYYIDKRDELTQSEYTTRIIIDGGTLWESEYIKDVIYATTKAKAFEILLDNYHGYDGDSVEIQHYNGVEWEVEGVYTWRE